MFDRLTAKLNSFTNKGLQLSCFLSYSLFENFDDRPELWQVKANRFIDLVKPNTRGKVYSLNIYVNICWLPASSKYIDGSFA